MRRVERPAACRALLAFLLCSMSGLAAAQDAKLPPTLTFTAYDTGSSGFSITVAIGKALKDRYGTDLRVLPAGNDVARLGPLKAGRAEASAMGIGAYFAQEGVFEFATKEWGPQRLRLVLSSLDCNGISLGVAKDTGVKEIKDLKGKRVGFVVGSPALNQNALAVLAFGGLTKADIKPVEFASYNAMWKGMLANEVDAAAASTVSGVVKEVESSPRGLLYPPLPVADKEGWARLGKIGPYFQPHKVTCGAGFTKEKPGEIASYPYPMFLVYAAQAADQVQAVATAMIETYPAYKDVIPGTAGLDVKQQNLKWVLPYHEGTARSLRKAGVWSDDVEAYNRKLIGRQDTLAAAWEAFTKAGAPTDKDAFAKAWMAARKAALTKAGLDPVFE